MRSHWFKFFLWNHGNYGSIYLCSHLAVKLKFLWWDNLSETIGLCTAERRDILWNGPVSLSDFKHDISKTAYLIDFTFWYGLNTTKTSDSIDLGHSTKIKMAATAVWRLTLYPMQDIACDCGSLKTACQIDFTFWYGLCTSNTPNIIDLGHSTKIKMAVTAVWRLTLYPMQDIFCESGSLKTAYLINFHLISGILWKTKWLP